MSKGFDVVYVFFVMQTDRKHDAQTCIEAAANIMLYSVFFDFFVSVCSRPNTREQAVASRPLQYNE